MIVFGRDVALCDHEHDTSLRFHGGLMHDSDQRGCKKLTQETHLSFTRMIIRKLDRERILYYIFF